jgi:ABC-type nitrate/sulfonate/bicarbonate transport system ATPase subunit
VARIEFRRAAKSFATREGELMALAGIDMAVADKEFVTLVGASGCGKSTLLNLIAGFESPTSGVILVDGAPIAGPGPDRGVVFQHTALFPWLSVADNIAFGLKLRANKGKGSPQVVTQRMLERTGLLPFRARLPQNCLAACSSAPPSRALAINPSTLLMDEPSARLMP